MSAGDSGRQAIRVGRLFGSAGYSAVYLHAYEFKDG